MSIDELNQKINELWHISRVALSSKSHSRYDRMIYVKNEINKLGTSPLNGKKLWLHIDKETQLFRPL